MKILKAKTSHPKKKILAISDLHFDRYYEKNNIVLEDLLKSNTLQTPIEVEQRKINPNPRVGALGVRYTEKDLVVLKGSQRITTAKKMGYTHIEGIIVND
jgi:predicted MPP superfamily phosphohydrolase